MAADLTFRIGAELTEIKGALAGLRQDFARLGQTAEQAGGRNAFQGMESGARSALGTVGRLVAGFATLAGAVRLIGAADELNTLNARLRLVTTTTEDYNRAQTALFDLSQRTRSSLTETVGLYARIAQATRDAGVGQETLLEVVETINQAVQLSGASTQAAEAALIQLGQGLASGTLRGEELNSVLEQTPALADAIAKGMGITRGELRAYGQEGRITAEQVIRALQAQRGEVARQFAELPLTVGQATTLLRNSSLQLLGAFNDTSGATAGLAGVIRDLAEFLGSDEVAGAVVEFAATWSGAFAQIVGDVQEAVRIIADATAGITADGGNLFDFIGRAFRELPVNVRTAIRIATIEIAAFVDSTITAMSGVAQYIRAIFDPETTVEQVRASLLRAQAVIEQARRETIDDTLADRDRALAEARAARDQVQRNRQAGRTPNPSARGLGNFRAGPSDADRRRAEQERKAQLDAEEKLARDSIERAKQFYADLYADAKLSAADYFATRQALELQALDQAIAVEQQRAAAGGVDRTKALAEIEILEREKAAVKARIQREEAAAERQRAQELAQLHAQDLANQGRTADARRIQLEAQYRDTIARMQAEGNTAGVELITRLINTDVARARFEELQREFERISQALQARQQALADQVTTGALSGDTAAQQQAEARAEALVQLQALNAQMQALAATTNDPAIVAGAEQISAALRQMAIDGATGIDAAIISLRSSLANLQQSFEQSVSGAGVDALSSLFTDLASGSKSAGDAIKDFARSFAASMAQIAARALATYLVLQLLEAVFPGAGKLVAASGSIGAGVQHGGGMAGSGPVRNVPAFLFAGAPRFHSGGMVGLKSDEVPAILQKGEEVLARDDPRNAANGGRQANGYRIVNVLDPSLVAGFLESSQGEEVIVNAIGRNPARVRQIIGA